MCCDGVLGGDMDRYQTDSDIWPVSPEILKNRTWVHILGPVFRWVFLEQYEEYPLWCLWNPPHYLPEQES
jgi:hypothetical protein